MRFQRTRSRCSECPLRSKTKVWGIGPDDPKMCFIGEAPGRDEDKSGEPFVGAAGKYFTWGLSQAGILRHRCWITNVLPCRPPDNEIHSSEALEALEFCREGFEEEIEFLLKKGVKVFAPLGGTPSKYMGIDIGITEARGSVFHYHNLPLIPTFHPSYLDRMRYSQGDKGSPQFKYVWIADLKKIKYISEVGWNSSAENFFLHPTVEDVSTWTSECKETDLIALDIETTSLNPYLGEIVVIGLARNSSDALSIPFYKQGGSYYWESNEESIIKKLLNDFFKAHKFLLQNALFDIRYLRRHGYEISMENVEHDTMLLHHCISPELPHRLGFIVSVYGDTPYWKEDFLKRDVSILEMDENTLWSYNLRDCVVLHQVIEPLLLDLKETGTELVYYKESLPLLPPVLSMMETGIKLDEKKLIDYQKELKRDLTQKEKELRQLGNLPDAFKFSSDEDVRYFLFGVLPNKLKNLEAKFLTKKKTSIRTDTKKYQELLKLKELQDKTKPIYVPAKFNGRTTQTGKIQVNKQGLLSFQRLLQNRLEIALELKTLPQDEINRIRKLLNWLDLFYQFSEIEKLISTYSSFNIDPDGRIRTSYLIHGTNTGRFSSKDPNLQNQPKKNLGIRKCFVAEEGKILLAADYSNLEVRVLAYETEDDILIDALEKGLNIHDENTKILFNINEKNKLWELARRAAKIFFFGCIAYGGGEREIYEKVILECPNLALTFNKFRSAKERYMQVHQSYTKWRRKIEEFIQKERKILNFKGRTRILMGYEKDIIKEGINFPIQCLHPRTKVLTTELRWVPLGELKKQDKLIAFDEEKDKNIGCRQWKIAKIDFLEKDKSELFRIFFADGSYIDATEEHKWLVYPKNPKRKGIEWVETGKLKNHQKIQLFFQVWKEEASYEAGYLSGAFDSDGTLYQTGTYTTSKFCQKDNIVQKEIEKCLKHFGFNYLRTDCSYTRRTKGYNWITTAIKGGIPEQLRFLGLIRPKRLLQKFDILKISKRFFNRGMRYKEVVNVKKIGYGDIVRIKTSTGTFFAEGMPTHNSGAASIINQAMIRIDKILQSTPYWISKLILQIHDELLFETIEEELPKLKTIVKQEMEKLVDFRGKLVSFPIEMKTGKSWGEMK